MIFSRKDNKYDKITKKKRKAIKLATDTGRRGFLKFIGIGSVAATSAVVSSAIPVSAKTKLLIEDSIKDTPEKALLPEVVKTDEEGFTDLYPGRVLHDPEELLPVDYEAPSYLIQPKTGRIYPFSQKLFDRGDMKILTPELSQKVHEDILQVQEFERKWENGIKSRLLRQYGNPNPDRDRMVQEALNDTGGFNHDSIQRLPITDRKGRISWVKPENLDNPEIMKKSNVTSGKSHYGEDEQA